MAIQPAARTPQAGHAPNTAAKIKVLRIGIVQGGRIVEERLVRSRDNISIGWSSKSTFAVPSEALPKQWMLFELTPKGYVARFADAMDARIAVGNEVISLAQLKQVGRIRRQGAAWLLLLDERSRGKISVGDLTILFQFVTPPPPQPRPRLPASVRGSWTTGLDWAFTLIGGVSFVGHLVFVLYLRNVDWPRKPDIEEIPDRFVQMVVKAKPPEAPKTETKEDKTEDKTPDKQVAANSAAKRAPKKEISAEEKARIDAERRARLAEQVRNTGILKLLGAKADGSGSIADVLGKGDVDRDQEKAFQGVGGLTVATSGESLRGVKSGTGGSGKVADIGSLRGAGTIAGGNTGAGATEKKVSGVVRSEAPAVDGELDPALVSKEVRARIGAVKACYERALKRNPNLSGKIKVRWTITAAGTVSGVDIADDSMGDSEVSSCIKQLVARWRFPAPAGGSVEVEFPFVFTASQ
ncbi:MAG TPA: AgmX/PglI C-terminal domain-containing protein [Polyangia bacterium]|jgi:TonB family C-terminal domain|nr:AgmX/PglI C-terminal domain-containing protein [Polyangia bacterium]